MKNLFLEVLELSIKSSYIILIFFGIRFLIRKLPKIYSYILMVLAFVRLVLFRSIPSVFSLFNYVEQRDIVVNYRNNILGAVEVGSGQQTLENISNTVKTMENTVSSVSNFNIWNLLGIIWIMGIAVLLAYSLYSYIKLKNKLTTAVKIKDNIYLSENISIPFVFGFIKPKIYFPLELNFEENEYILEHEKIHIRRKDYIIKPICFAILVVHWFNPLVWLSYYFLVQDMEMSCDEKVVGKFEGKIKVEYSKNILDFATKRNKYFMVPIAFSESNIRSRIKNILKYRKYPRLVGIVLVLMLTIIGCTTLPNSRESDLVTNVVAENNEPDYEPDHRYHEHEELEQIRDKEKEGLYNNRTDFETVNTRYGYGDLRMTDSIGEHFYLPSHVTLESIIPSVDENSGENIINIEVKLDKLAKYLLPSRKDVADEYYFSDNVDIAEMNANLIFVTINDVDKVVFKYKYNSEIEERVFEPKNRNIFKDNQNENSFKYYIDEIEFLNGRGYFRIEQLRMENNRIRDNSFGDIIGYGVFGYLNFNYRDYEEDYRGYIEARSGEYSQIPVGIKVDDNNIVNYNYVVHYSLSKNDNEKPKWYRTDTILIKVIFQKGRENSAGGDLEYVKTKRMKVDEVTKNNFDTFFGKGEYEKYKDKIKTKNEVVKEILEREN
ncbi:M56 family metallopeptidase [Miniphocaeibacter halophilus]|uniref:Uncharacterized protein n=1 Tax=Miniphocaeibacter halophilus TaxID=2931922 RepID=A0AC61MTS3_9FIRM|nr:M56 family metallopeptidase [Miniphocaeibacter halophilus]QQK08773.1 hypothetical protein JFY71_04370 [Miniphocaeibacter halophilus]